MTLLGEAAVAMWWDIRQEKRGEFCDWHSHEHFPERLRIPGFRRGSRWSSSESAEGFFVLYELADYATLSSKAYLDRLNSPTPWSVKMMPHHLNMVRSQCRIVDSFGGGVAPMLATIRFSPQRETKEALQTSLARLLSALPSRPGLAGAHLLITDTPQGVPQTAEQKQRGADQVADWIVLIAGYEQKRVRDACREVMAQPEVSAAIGSEPAAIIGHYQLSFAMTPQDLG